MRKKRFPIQRHNKLPPRGDGPFQMLEHINDNAYKVELPGEYGVSATFNVSDLSPFDADDAINLRTNPSQEKGNDDNGVGGVHGSGDQVLVPVGPITRACAKKLKEQLNTLVHVVHDSIEGSKMVEDLNREGHPIVMLLSSVYKSNISEML